MASIVVMEADDPLSELTFLRGIGGAFLWAGLRPLANEHQKSNPLIDSRHHAGDLSDARSGSF